MSGNNNNNNKMALVVRANPDSAPTPNSSPAPHDNRVQLAAIRRSTRLSQSTNNNSKVNSTTKNGEEVKMETPHSNNGDSALIHICNWHGDFYMVHNYPSPPQSLPAAASSLHQDQQHQH